MTRPFALLLCCLLLTACAPPKVRTTTLIPAPYHEAAKLKQLAVVTIDGRGGSAFAAELEAALANIATDGHPYFTLLEQTRLDQILNEQELAASQLIDPDTATEVGRLAGVMGIVAGNISRTLTDTNYREKHTFCLEREAPPKNAKKDEGKCLRSEQRHVPCTKRELVLTFTPKIIDVSSAKIVYSRALRSTRTDAVCGDSGRSLASEPTLYGQAKESVLAAITQDIAPHYATFVFNLMDDDDGINSPEALNRFTSGLDFAKNNRLDRACELWQAAYPLAPQAPALLYNLGVCAEINGNLEKAKNLFVQADHLLSEPHDDVSRALRRIETALANQRQLDEQLQ